MALSNSTGPASFILIYWKTFRKRSLIQPLVLHGASSVPEEEVRRITAAGGTLHGARGVDPDLFKTAARLGIAKINIATDSRLSGPVFTVNISRTPPSL
jgi:fructose/tagatose bisphosphate aldolase